MSVQLGNPEVELRRLSGYADKCRKRLGVLSARTRPMTDEEWREALKLYEHVAEAEKAIFYLAMAHHNKQQKRNDNDEDKVRTETAEGSDGNIVRLEAVAPVQANRLHG